MTMYSCSSLTADIDSANSRISLSNGSITAVGYRFGYGLGLKKTSREKKDGCAYLNQPFAFEDHGR
jgi:hypothetical protein